jgi:hypothetical protein
MDFGVYGNYNIQTHKVMLATDYISLVGGRMWEMYQT